MLTKSGRRFFFILLICTQAAVAQTQSPEPKAAESTIADVIEWVKREGQDAILSKDVARIFGWGEDNVLVSRMALSNPEARVSFAFDVVKEKPNVVLFWRKPDEMIVWQMSGSGELLKTLRADKNGVKLIDNPLHLADWQSAIDVYRGLVPPPR